MISILYMLYRLAYVVKAPEISEMLFAKTKVLRCPSLSSAAWTPGTGLFGRPGIGRLKWWNDMKWYEMILNDVPFALGCFAGRLYFYLALMLMTLPTSSQASTGLSTCPASVDRWVGGPKFVFVHWLRMLQHQWDVDICWSLQTCSSAHRRTMTGDIVFLGASGNPAELPGALRTLTSVALIFVVVLLCVVFSFRYIVAVTFESDCVVVPVGETCLSLRYCRKLLSFAYTV